MDFHLAEIDLTSDPSAPYSPFWEGVTEVGRADSLETFGYDDFAETDNASRVESLRDAREQRRVVMLALAGSVPEGATRGPYGHRVVPSTGDSSISPDDVLAVLFVDAPILDNEHMGYLDLTVHPDHRGHGIGTALASEGERILAEWDRTTLLVWSVVTRAVSEQTQGTIVDPAGTVALRTDDPVVRFPLDRGYSFSQAERHSLQPLPVPAEVIAEALGEAEAKADGYELVQFVGQPTEDLVEGLAPLFAAMSTDPPLGAVDWRPEVWDVDRVVRAYEQMARGKELYTTLARHVSSGEIVAFTQLKAPYDKPEVVWQENTLVLASHRGHALGLWIKAANLELVTKARPSSRRVHTWNADENDYMLAINTRLGYHRESIGAAWQKVLR
jgi:GNAT superfamily N-acetyltransferase